MEVETPVLSEGGKASETQKDISYSIVIPADPTVSGEQVLTDRKLKVRPGGYAGETLCFWLCATWDASSSFLGKIEWNPELFACEITNTQYDNPPSHISTTEIVKPSYARELVIKESSAAVPLSVTLPKIPASSADLSVWKDDFATHVVSSNISITLPVSYICNFSVEQDAIRIALDFAGTMSTVKDYDLHFMPRSNVRLCDYEEAFALRKIEGAAVYELSIAKNQGLRLLKGMYLGLAVTWGDRGMVSNFDVEITLPPSILTVVWTVPQLKRMRQAKLAVELQNISHDPIDAVIEMSDSPLLPLEKKIEVKAIAPGENRNVIVPCVPTVLGIHELGYKIRVGARLFKPLFQTVVEIT